MVCVSVSFTVYILHSSEEYCSTQTCYSTVHACLDIGIVQHNAQNDLEQTPTFCDAQDNAYLSPKVIHVTRITVGER